MGGRRLLAVELDEAERSELEALARDDHRQLARLLRPRRLVEQAAAAENDTGLQQVPPAVHGRLPDFGQFSAASLTGSPAMRLCHMMRRWVMSQGVAWCSRQRLSHSSASPGRQSWCQVRGALAGEVDEPFEEALRLGLVHAGDVVRVAADQQRLAAGLGMDLHQLPQRHRPVMEAVAAVLAVGLALLLSWPSLDWL